MDKQDLDQLNLRGDAELDVVELDDSVLREFRGRKEHGEPNGGGGDGIGPGCDKRVKSESAQGKAARWGQLHEQILEMETDRYLGDGKQVKYKQESA